MQPWLSLGISESPGDQTTATDVASGMANPISPSPIIEVFVSEVHASFPEVERQKIASYAEAISKTTSDGDSHRARLCVRWAIRMADDKNRKHPRWEQLKERHQIWKDDWFALEFAMGDAIHISGSHHIVGKAEPTEDIRIKWVENAVAVAKRLGEEDGWESSPWEELLTELVDYENG